MKISELLPNITKIVLSVLFLICLVDMPYGYFQLVRFLALAGFAMLAYITYQEGNQKITLVYILLAALFQPFIKIPLGRDIWNVIDIVVAIGLLASIFVRGKTGRAGKRNF